MSETPNQAANRLSQHMIEQGYAPEALHPYTNAQGEPIFWRLRLKHPVTGEKWIRPMMRDGDSYAMKEPPFEAGKPLYRLHQIERSPETPVVLVEGEKCADALAKLALLATTSGSADSVEKADWTPLEKRRVLLWPDNDDAGARFATEATAKLTALGCEVRLVDVKALELPPKGDCVDWLATHPEATGGDVWRLPCVQAERSPETPSEVIRRLGTLKPFEYQQARKAEAKRLGVSVTWLDGEVSREQQAKDDRGASIFPLVEPWGEPVDAAELLNDIHTLIRSYLICDPEVSVAATLWIAFTWFIDHVNVAPLAVITAPEKRCGKSILLGMMSEMTRRPLTAANITASAVFRVVEECEPTLLVDEADTFLAKNEELRGVINSGHTRRTAFIVRTNVNDHSVERFRTWGAKAFAGIGTVPDTIMDRAVVMTLRRKLEHEEVECFFDADMAPFQRLASKLARLEQDAAQVIASSRPPIPKGMHDRAKDNWRPLLAIADYAGGNWPERARDAARAISDTKEKTTSVSVELLSDVRDVFTATGVDRIASAELLKRLNADEEKRWATYYRGQPMTARLLASRLREFGVEPRLIRIETGVMRGYHREDFDDAFRRYLSPLPPPAESVTALQRHGNAANEDGFGVTDLSARTAREGAVTDDSTYGAHVTDGVAEEGLSFQSCNAVTAPNEDEEEEIIEVVV